MNKDVIKLSVFMLLPVVIAAFSPWLVIPMLALYLLFERYAVKLMLLHPAILREPTDDEKEIINTALGKIGETIDKVYIRPNGTNGGLALWSKDKTVIIYACGYTIPLLCGTLQHEIRHLKAHHPLCKAAAMSMIFMVTGIMSFLSVPFIAMLAVSIMLNLAFLWMSRETEYYADDCEYGGYLIDALHDTDTRIPTFLLSHPTKEMRMQYWNQNHKQ